MQEPGVGQEFEKWGGNCKWGVLASLPNSLCPWSQIVPFGAQTLGFLPVLWRGGGGLLDCGERIQETAATFHPQPRLQPDEEILSLWNFTLLLLFYQVRIAIRKFFLSLHGGSVSFLQVLRCWYQRQHREMRGGRLHCVSPLSLFLSAS